MSRKNELFEVQKLLERIENELGHVKESLNEYFAREGQAMPAYETSMERSSILTEEVLPAALHGAGYPEPDMKGPERSAKEIRL